MSPPSIRYMLDLGTSHLPVKPGTDDEPIDLAAEPGVVADDLETGFLMWVPNDPQDSAQFGDEMRPEILTIQLFARRHHCDYVLFDSDGTISEWLPRFDIKEW